LILRPDGSSDSSVEESAKDLSEEVEQEKKYILSGLVVLLPIATTLLVLNWILTRVNLIPGTGLLNLTSIYIVNQILKLGALIAVGSLLIAFTGRLVRTNGGFRAEQKMDSLFTSLPVIGSIYRITKVTAETVTGSSSELRTPVKIKVNGMRLTAFKTGNITDDGRPILFLPTAPNITTGLVIEASPEDIIETEEKSGEALTRVLSAGFGQDNKN